MEILHALEQKIESLVELIKREKEEAAKLSGENRELLSRINQLESALLHEAKKVELELKEERSATRQVVDELIKNIDDLIENGGVR